ncbi:hypothetical protein [Corynebacterium liangguodongii]|nr:hypothetical protein [Corynebacterium liangguodongii]
MNAIQLSTETSLAARRALPGWPALPEARLSAGQAAAGLASFQQRARSLVDAPSAAARTRCASIASFAAEVISLDRRLAEALTRCADGRP